MIVLITGDRDYRNQREMWAVLDRVHAQQPFSYLVHGDQSGADQMSHRWAKKRGVPPVAMEALRDVEGPDAGPIRNGRMLEFAKPYLVIAFSGGRGTNNMIKQAVDKGIPVIDVEDL
jgi:hypothetical protein